MDYKKFLREKMPELGISFRSVAPEMGISWQSIQKMFLAQRDVTTAKLIRLLDICGYDLIVMPKDMPLPDGAVKLDPPAGTREFNPK